jgi:hypothetical protein
MIESTLDTIHRMNCTFTPLNSMWLLHTMNNVIIIVAQDPHSESVVLACILQCSCLLEKIIFRRSTPHKDGIERERERESSGALPVADIISSKAIGTDVVRHATKAID